MDDVEGKNETRKLTTSVLDSAAWLLSPAPALQVMLSEGMCWSCRAPGCSWVLGERAARWGAAWNRTRGSLAKPALCCHTPELQINVGARGQAGRRGGNRSVAHHSKLGQQGVCWKFHQKHWVSSGSVTARPNVAWSSWDLLAQEWKWEHGLRLSHNTKSKKKLNQPY